MKLPAYKYLFAFIDFIIILTAFILSAYLVRTDEFADLFAFMGTAHNLFTIFVPLTIVIIFIFQTNNLYKLHIALSKSLHVVAIIKSMFYGILLVIFFSFLLKYSFILDSRRFIFFFTGISLLGLVVLRVLIIRNLLLRLHRIVSMRRNVLIIGSGNSAKLLAAKLQMENDLGIKVLGFIDESDDVNLSAVTEKMVLGGLKDLPDLVNRINVDEIIISIDNTTYEQLLEILDICNKLDANIKLSSDLFKIVSQKMDTEKYSDVPIVDASPRVNKKVNDVFKLIFDFIGATLGLIILSPLLIIIALFIKLSSRGPVFYAQTRIGKNGKPFKFYKFRSMKVSEEGEKERQKQMVNFIKNGGSNNNSGNKIINSKRVTWIGNIIRKTSLDELPQLINVLKGEMSLVGPRPCLPYEYENFDNWQKRKVNVLPGCTGVWQVAGRSSVSFNDSIVLDLYYINNMSPWLDLQIILKTLPVMLFAKGGK